MMGLYSLRFHVTNFTVITFEETHLVSSKVIITGEPIYQRAVISFLGCDVSYILLDTLTCGTNQVH